MAQNLPTSGSAAPTQELVKEMQRVQEQQQAAKEQSQTPNVDFGAHLNEQQSAQVKQDSKVAQVGQVAASHATSTDVLKTGKAQMASPSTRIGATEKLEESKLQAMIDNLVNGQDKMTKIMQMALSGRQFGPSELLAMQAGVYRYSQELDLTSKVVQQATAGIKQTLNTQV